MFAFTSRARFLAGGVLTSLVYVALTAGTTAQQKASPPDFSSNQAGWLTFRGEFIAVSGGPSPLRNDPAHPVVANNNGAQPTFRIGDLGNPNLRPSVVERMKKDNAEVLAGKIAFTPRSSCMPAGVPASGDQQIRHVCLDIPHSANPKPSWYGESVGHYEGDTLVVDTIGLNDKTFVDNYRTPHTEKLHVVERWTLLDGGKTLEANVRVEDPDTFNEPWSGIQRYDRVQQPMTEQVCAENNQHLFDYHIPVAAKSDF
jgi:hypothetical protein